MGTIEIISIENNEKPTNIKVCGAVLSRFRRVKTESFSGRGSTTVTLNLNILYIPQYEQMYTPGVPTNKKEEWFPHAGTSDR